MPGVQPEVNSPFIVHARGSGPVDIIRADHTAATPRECVRDPTILVAVTRYREHGA